LSEFPMDGEFTTSWSFRKWAQYLLPCDLHTAALVLWSQAEWCAPHSCPMIPFRKRIAQGTDKSSRRIHSPCLSA
jgi:hypothetical protein